MKCSEVVRLHSTNRVGTLGVGFLSFGTHFSAALPFVLNCFMGRV